MKEKIQALKREHILEVATKHFSETGYENTKMSTVAKEAGVSIGTIYDFFDNKEGVFKAVLFSIIESTHAVVLEKLKDITDPKEKLIVYMENKLEATKEHRETISELLKATPWFFSKIAIADPLIAIRGDLEEIFKELGEKEKLKTKDYKLLAVNFKFYSEGYMVLAMESGSEIDTDPRDLVEQFLYGVVQ